jgi:hypothetical protein
MPRRESRGIVFGGPGGREVGASPSLELRSATLADSQRTVLTLIQNSSDDGVLRCREPDPCAA